MRGGGVGHHRDLQEKVLPPARPDCEAVLRDPGLRAGPALPERLGSGAHRWALDLCAGTGDSLGPEHMQKLSVAF